MTEQDQPIEQPVIPPNRRRRSKLLFLMFGGAIGIIMLVIGGYQLIEFTDSTAFCGKLCHNVMSAEFTTYQASPHSRVSCAECHVGSGASYLVKSKISGIPMIISTITGKFERPIPTPVENLRPARETCENCHRPERFAGDLVQTHTTYALDEKNTEKVDTRVMRVGGGESETASGIHWHIANSVYYLPGDNKRANIDWVGVQQPDGTLTEYINPKTDITPEQIKSEKRLMDCIDCHNRATHVFQSPDGLIDSAMAQGKIDKTLPFIKKSGIEALDPPNSSLDEAITKVEGIKDFYKSSYPDIVKTKEAAIDKAIEQLKEVARLTTFPEMNATWKSYPDNATHTGCMRCHGKLVAKSGEQTGKTISADCNSCHYFEVK